MEVSVGIDFAQEKNLFFTGFAHPKPRLWKSCELDLRCSNLHTHDCPGVGAVVRYGPHEIRLEAVHDTLASLSELELLEQCARQPGQKEKRFYPIMHTSTGFT